MVITLTIIVSIIIGCFIPKNLLKKYFILVAIGLSSLYFIINPTESDMSRHFELLEDIRKVSWIDIFTMQSGNYGNWFLNSYIPLYPIFCIYAKFMSYFAREWYVVVVALIIYLMPITYCFNDYKTEKHYRWIYVVSYVFFLLNFDFLSISGIRNMITAMLFCRILYAEFIETRNRIICWIAYILICFIHSYGIMLLMIRLILIFTNKYTKVIVGSSIFIGYMVLTSGNTFLIRVIPNGFLRIALLRFISYTDFTGTTVPGRRVYMLLVYILLMVIMYSYSKINIHDDRIGIKYGYKKIYDYFWLVILFTLGAYSQYDTFIRGGFIIFPLCGILVKNIFAEIGGKRFLRIKLKGSEDKYPRIICYVCILIEMIAIFFYLSRTGYLYMDSWFFN